MTNGNVALNGALSMPANGRLLAFPAFRLAAESKITQQEVRVLPADGRVRLLKVRLPGGTGGMSPVTGLSIAW